jgi:hypothetical protein
MKSIKDIIFKKLRSGIIENIDNSLNTDILSGSVKVIVIITLMHKIKDEMWIHYSIEIQINSALSRVLYPQGNLFNQYLRKPV